MGQGSKRWGSTLKGKFASVWGLTFDLQNLLLKEPYLLIQSLPNFGSDQLSREANRMSHKLLTVIMALLIQFKLEG